jgi:hypothetical protein
MVLVCFLITVAPIRNKLVRGEKLAATSGFMLRLEIGMLRVLLELGEILNACVLRLEVWRRVEMECGGRAFGDEFRSFAQCMRPLRQRGRWCAYTERRCMITYGY